MNSDAGIPYIGSRISLTSKSAIRYEGTLYTIDTNESTVALKDVQSFGTEHRPRAGGFIPPSPEIYEFVIFRGPDIDELNVINAVESVVNKNSSLPSDPAIVASSPKPSSSVSQSSVQYTSAPRPPIEDANGVSASKSEETSSYPAHDDSAPANVLPVENQQANGVRHTSEQPPQPKYAPARPTIPTARSWGPPPSASSSQVSAPSKPSVRTARDIAAAVADESRPVANGTQAISDKLDQRSSSRQPHGQTRASYDSTANRRRQRRDIPHRNPGIEIPKEDFDFEAMNEKFDKASLSTAATDSVGDVGENYTQDQFEPKYNKSESFFDMLEPAPRDRSTPSERNQRRLADFETFGEHYHHRGHGRRRGRGGRGGRGRRGGRGNSRAVAYDDS